MKRPIKKIKDPVVKINVFLDGEDTRKEFKDTKEVFNKLYFDWIKTKWKNYNDLGKAIEEVEDILLVDYGGISFGLGYNRADMYDDMLVIMLRDKSVFLIINSACGHNTFADEAQKLLDIDVTDCSNVVFTNGIFGKNINGDDLEDKLKKWFNI